MQARMQTHVHNPNERTSLCFLQLHCLLGRGKYSQVYAATHAQTGMRVAMKKVSANA